VWQRKLVGALGRNRTCDQEIRRLLLYPLSYEGKTLLSKALPSLSQNLPSKTVKTE
jgi:hypothetical protein